MPNWPGGECPSCGEWMPPNQVRCRNCRTLLNEDLKPDSVEIPQFVPLQEVDSMVEVSPSGYYILCPHCDKELRINRKYIGQGVSCKFCAGSFRFDLSSPTAKPVAFYSDCPHCQEELRVAIKYLGMKVACKLCSGKLHFVPNGSD